MIVPPKINNEREVIIWREWASRLLNKLDNKVFPPDVPIHDQMMEVMWDSSLSKMVAWNGSEWIPLD